MNIAGIHNLPVLNLCQNNFNAYSTPTPVVNDYTRTHVLRAGVNYQFGGPR